ncbi:MAG: cysteine dioxygenase family protein [Saprospiraceae bacterium]
MKAIHSAAQVNETSAFAATGAKQAPPINDSGPGTGKTTANWMPYHIPISLLTEKAFADIARGRIPNFQRLCRQLLKTIDPAQTSFSALQFLDALVQHSFHDPADIRRVLRHPDSSHVLVHNEYLKVILIRWEPGQASNLHGHATGGCVFKVLHGTVEESRYAANAPEKQLARNTYFAGNMAYIDDRMGFHVVRNVGTEPAVTMHLYTPGGKKRG